MTKVCYDCRQAKRVELFDLDRKRGAGRSAQCKACRRQRQNRGGYGTCRNRALAELERLGGDATTPHLDGLLHELVAAHWLVPVPAEEQLCCANGFLLRQDAEA